jgi:hypothetical protein
MNDFTHEVITTRIRLPMLIWPLLLIMALGVYFAVKENTINGVIAVIPCLSTSLILMTRRTQARFTIRDDGLDFEAPVREFVSYQSIVYIDPERIHVRDCNIVFYYHRTAIRIMGRLSVDPHDLLDFIDSRCTPDESIPLSDELDRYRQQQVDQFGEERVYVYQAKQVGRPPHSERALILTAYGLVIGIGLMIPVAIAFMKDDAITPLIVTWGFWLGLIGLFVLIRTRRPARREQYFQSALVISPLGFALEQDQLKGKIRWDEVQTIDCPPQPGSFITQTGKSKTGVGVRVAGAYIVILNRYPERPIRIASQMRQIWQG